MIVVPQLTITRLALIAIHIWCNEKAEVLSTSTYPLSLWNLLLDKTFLFSMWVHQARLTVIWSDVSVLTGTTQPILAGSNTAL